MSATEKDTGNEPPFKNLSPPSPTGRELHVITRSQWESIPGVSSYENHALPVDANLETWRLFSFSIKQCTVIQNLLADRNSRTAHAGNGQWVLSETNRGNKSDNDDEFAIIITFYENNSPTATDEQASEVGKKGREMDIQQKAEELGMGHFGSSTPDSHTVTTERGAGSESSILPVDTDSVSIEPRTSRGSVLAVVENTDEAPGYCVKWSSTIHARPPIPLSASDSHASTPVPTQATPVPTQATPVPTQATPAIPKQLSEDLGEALEAPKSLDAEGQNQLLVKMASLGHTYLQANNAKDAKLLLESAIPNLERIFGEYDQHTLATKFDLANAYRCLENYKDAIPLLKSLFESRNEPFSPDAEEILSSMLSILQSQRLLPEFYSLATYLLQDHKDNLGNQRTKIVKAVKRLADLYHPWNLDRAKKLYQCAVENHREAFGQDEQLLKTIDSLVDIHVEYGELCKAETLLRSELYIRKQDFGERHDRTLETMRSLGNIYMRRGRLEEALLLFQAAENGAAYSQ